jgi:signal transduction histidine kinase
MTEAQIDQRLGKIREQVGHLKNIMEDVLQLAQIQSQRVVFNPVRLDLDAICRSLLDEFQSRPDVSHQFIYHCDDVLRDVYLDKKLMRQVISNLLSNAIKYSPADKPLSITLEYVDHTLVLTVKDEGIGIPEADLKHLFEAFHRAANVGTIAGTGLGLTITKEAVELHGGTITVDSRVGHGTAFIVRIPVKVNGEIDDDTNPGH